jgi:hypothetical protein
MRFAIPRCSSLLAFALSATVAASTAFAGGGDSRFVGTWFADKGPGALPGRIVFTKQGHVTLQPDGFEPVDGTWTAKNGLLVMKVPNMGAAAAGARFTGNNTLTLDYPDGTRQVFTRVPAQHGKEQ